MNKFSKMLMPTIAFTLSLGFTEVSLASTSSNTPSPLPPGSSVKVVQHHKHSHSIFKKVASLHLTHEQCKQINDIHHQAYEDMQPAFASAREGDLVAITSPSSADYNDKIGLAADKFADYTKQRVLTLGKVKKSIYDILTPAQKEKVDKEPQILNFLMYFSPTKRYHHWNHKHHIHN